MVDVEDEMGEEAALVEVANELVIVAESSTRTDVVGASVVVKLFVVDTDGTDICVVDDMNVENSFVGSVGGVVEVAIEALVEFAVPAASPNNSVDGFPTSATSMLYCPGFASANSPDRASAIAPLLAESRVAATSVLVTVMLSGASPPTSIAYVTATFAPSLRDDLRRRPSTAKTSMSI